MMHCPSCHEQVSMLDILDRSFYESSTRETGEATAQAETLQSLTTVIADLEPLGPKYRVQRLGLHLTNVDLLHSRSARCVHLDVQRFEAIGHRLAHLREAIRCLRQLLDGVHFELSDRMLALVRSHLDWSQPLPLEAFVLSVDIRRSTELMLKAESPQAFARYMSWLTRAMGEGVRANAGIVDKFTGDGLLAYFPVALSDSQLEAGRRAVAAAVHCHEVFSTMLTWHGEVFSTEPISAGLGIGIDFGTVNLVSIADSLTIMGQPVVYACRLNAAPTGATYLNNRAGRILGRPRSGLSLSEVELEIKHEGRIKVWQLVGNNLAEDDDDANEEV